MQDDVGETCTQSEMARRLGVSRRAVGDLMTRRDVDPDTWADRRRGRVIVDPERFQTQASRYFAPKTAAGASATFPEGVDLDDRSTWPLELSSEIDKHFSAYRRMLAAQREKGELMPRSDVERQVGNVLRVARDHFLGIADQVSDDLAAEDDAGRIHALLTERFERTLASAVAELESMDGSEP